MSILSYFTDWETTPIEIRRISSTFDQSTGRHTSPSESLIASVDAIFYKAGQSESVVAQQIRERVSAICIFDVGTNVLAKDIIVVRDKRYSAIDVDNVAYQDEALVVPLELIS